LTIPHLLPLLQYLLLSAAAAAADALARGAKALEDKAPDVASALYGEALEQYESDGKEAQATDVFRQAIALLVKRQVGPSSAPIAAVSN
jgi:hypothetical protein